MKKRKQFMTPMWIITKQRLDSTCTKVPETVRLYRSIEYKLREYWYGTGELLLKTLNEL